MRTKIGNIISELSKDKISEEEANKEISEVMKTSDYGSITLKVDNDKGIRVTCERLKAFLLYIGEIDVDVIDSIAHNPPMAFCSFSELEEIPGCSSILKTSMGNVFIETNYLKGNLS